MGSGLDLLCDPSLQTTVPPQLAPFLQISPLSQNFKSNNPSLCIGKLEKENQFKL